MSVIVMNPQNGEIMAMVNVPEFHLNDPFTLVTEPEQESQEEEEEQESQEAAAQNKENTQDLLNQMWRNQCINDTYEPGSVFKIITAASAFEEGVVSLKDSFFCPGYKVVEDRRIHCHKRTGHGAEDFTQGL